MTKLISEIIHEMNLNLEPFDAIKRGNKTVEMRLNDEKRQAIGKGDFIRFANNTTGETLLVRVVDTISYPSFRELYDAHDKISIGYNPKDFAEPADMLSYYSEDKIKKYGALAIIIQLAADEF